MNRHKAARSTSALFVDVYKWVYLLAILANLFLMTRDPIDNWATSQYVIDAVVFLSNLGSWCFFRRGNRFAYIVERALSLGRMAMCFAIGSIVLGSLAVMLSPIQLVLWFPLFDLDTTRSVIVLWTTCLALIALEICYFRSLERIEASLKESLIRTSPAAGEHVG